MILLSLSQHFRYKHTGNKKKLRFPQGYAIRKTQYITYSQFPSSTNMPSKIAVDKSILNETFKLDIFRTNQLEAIEAKMDGDNCLIFMPTGSGKSLCFQLPALLTDGVTIVRSPLKSLILDQVDKLLSLNINATYLSSEQNNEEIDNIYK